MIDSLLRMQVQLAKMEQLHERQQHVMRRKIEETVAVNKRLKDALEKQAMARAQKGGDKVLAGSGTMPIVVEKQCWGSGSACFWPLGFGSMRQGPCWLRYDANRC
jgi:hypothetical protein